MKSGEHFLRSHELHQGGRRVRRATAQAALVVNRREVRPEVHAVGEGARVARLEQEIPAIGRLCGRQPYPLLDRFMLTSRVDVGNGDRRPENPIRARLGTISYEIARGGASGQPYAVQYVGRRLLVATAHSNLVSDPQGGRPARRARRTPPRSVDLPRSIQRRPRG